MRLGGSVSPIADSAAARQKASEGDARDGGAHGFDPYDPTMRAVFVAHGPSFKPGVALPVTPPAR